MSTPPTKNHGGVENNNVGRLLHTLFPFVIFVFIQRLLFLLLSPLELFDDPTATSLLAFLPAAAASVLLFRLKTYSLTPKEENAPIPPPEKSHPVHGVLGIVAAVAMLIVLMFLVGVPFDTASMVPHRSLLSFFSLVLIHPMVEEYVFRGLFYGELRLLHPVFGCLMQTVMFAIIHDSVAGMIYALGSGIVLAYLMENTGRLWVPIAAHSIINLRSYLCLTLLANQPELAAFIDRCFLIVGFVSFVFFLAIRNFPDQTAATDETDGEDTYD